jgi:glycerol kinase
MPFGFDLGSSSAKAIRVDRRGRPAAVARRPIATRRARGGRVEHNAAAILQASLAALQEACGRGEVAPGDEGLGIATQRSTVLFWDRDSGRPLTPAYSWQDRRGAAFCARLAVRPRRGRPRGTAPPATILAREDPAGMVAERTGLRLGPHYSASKLAWALAHRPGLRRRVATGRALWGTTGTFILWRLTGGAVYAIDHANAQRTLLFDIGRLAWDPELFALFGLEALLDAPAMPALVPTWLSEEVRVEVGRRSLRLRAMTGDQQAALAGLACRRAGDVAINYGSGAFVLRNTGIEPRRIEGLLTTLVSSWAGTVPGALPGTGCGARFAVEGPVNAAATALDWVRRRLRLRVRTAAIDAYLGPDDGRPRRVHFLPAISGLGAPRWDPEASARFTGEVAAASPRDLLRSAVESIAMRCAEVLRAATPPRSRGLARETGGEAPVRVSGGLTRCATLLQAQADLLQRPILVVASPDATAKGAAEMARHAPSEDAGRARGRAASRAGDARARAGRDEGARIVRPRISAREAEARYRSWTEAVYGSAPARAAR